MSFLKFSLKLGAISPWLMLKSQQFASEIQKWLKSRNIVFHIRNKVTLSQRLLLDWEKQTFA